MKLLAGNDITIYTWSNLGEFMHAEPSLQACTRSFLYEFCEPLVAIQMKLMAEAGAATSSPNAEDTPRIRGRKKVKRALEWLRTKQTRLCNHR